MDIIITNDTYVTVFFIPIILFIASILGNESAGPANKRANAGPFPIPLPISPCKIGTSVKVAKYINAPTIEAKKFENKLFPPTRVAIHFDGIIPSFPGLPSKKPATKTPPNSKGIICNEKS